MRRTLLLLTLIAAASSAGTSQSDPRMTNTVDSPVRVPFSYASCRGADLSVRHVSEDAAMGGQNTIDYAFKNNSSSPCTLMGYPRFELLDRAGRVRPRGRAIDSQQLPGDEAKQ